MKWTLLFLALPCFAQLPVVPDMTPASSGNANYPNVTAPSYRWVASDISGNGQISSWLDRVQSYVLTNGAAVGRPFKNKMGVNFGARDVLTNVPPGNLKSSFAILVAQNHVYNVPNSHGTIWADDVNANGLAITGTNTASYLQGGSSTLGPGLAINTGTLLTVASDSLGHIWTNGTQQTASSHSGSYNPGQIGGFGANVSVPQVLIEVAGWTTDISSTDASNLNYYATNTYSFPALYASSPYYTNICTKSPVLWWEAEWLYNTNHGANSLSFWTSSGLDGSSFDSANAGTFPTWVASAAGGLPAMDFSSSQIYLNGDRFFNSVTYSAPMTYYIVCYDKSFGSGGQSIISYSEAGAAPVQQIAYIQGGTFGTLRLYDGTTTVSTGQVTTNVYLIRATFNGASSSIYTNMVSAGTGTLNGGLQSLQLSFTVGQYNLNGLLSAFLVFTNAMDPTHNSNDDFLVSTYLTNKYKITSAGQ